MGFDRVLTQPCLLERLLKAIQDWLVRELYRVDPLLIRLGMVSFRHATSLLQLRRSSPVSAGCQDEFAILVFLCMSTAHPFKDRMTKHHHGTEAFLSIGRAF